MPLDFPALDSFLALNRTSLVRASELALVASLATHMTLGLRLLAIELFNICECAAAVLSGCAIAAVAVEVEFLPWGGVYGSKTLCGQDSL